MGLLANLLVFSALLFVWKASSSRVGTRLDVDAGLSRRFERWMTEYERVYGDENEKEKRFQIFKKNVAYIEASNNNKAKTYKLGVNMFADLTQEEVTASYKGRRRSNNSPLGVVKSTFKYENVTDIPSSIDWRDHGAVSPVQDQGRNCGSCYAFSTAASVEGILKIAKGQTVELSAQQVLDCAPGCGCETGNMTDSLNYIERTGLSTEASYPYKAVQGRCNTSVTAVAFIKGYERVPVDEMALMRAVAHQPVVAVIDNHNVDFTLYNGGVYEGPCGMDTDLSVAIVGYGTDPNGTNYWILKNSFGTHWGEKGYMRLKRLGNDPRGLCGIATEVYYPII